VGDKWYYRQLDVKCCIFVPNLKVVYHPPLAVIQFYGLVFNTSYMSNTLKEKRTKNGWTIKLVQIGTMYSVLSYHEKKRGYGTRYAGKSKEAAMKAFNK